MSKFGEAMGAAAENDPGAFGQVAQGLTQFGTSLIGGRARRKEQKAAGQELGQRKQAYESFQFTNPYENMENVFEDLTVNQQAAQFAAQQGQQALASQMSGMQQAAGSSGIASLAQVMAQQQQSNIQQASMNIASQEQANQMAAAQGASQIQQAERAGMAEKQQFELGRTETLFDMASQRKLKADEARAQATQDLIGGVSNMAVGAGRIAAAGA
jgi:hypothetical protein